MGFDFGDSEPEKETPAAGFRIKTMKPAPKADAGESEPKKDLQNSGDKSEESSGKETPKGTPQAIQTAIPDTNDEEMPYIGNMSLHTPASENDPNNDSEVIHNIPSEKDTDKTPGSAHENSGELHVADIPVQTTSAAPIAEEPETDELEAVEEVIEEEEEKAEEKKDSYTPSEPVIFRLQEEPAEEPYAAPVQEEPAPQNAAPVANSSRGPLLPPKQIYAEPAKQPAEKSNTQPVAQAPVQQASAASAVKAETPAKSEQVSTDTNQFTSGVVPDSHENPVNQRNEPANTAPKSAEPAAKLPAPVDPVAEFAAEDEFIIQENNPAVPDEETGISEEAVQAKKSTRGRKSLKALDAEASHVHIPEDSTLFRRQYYSIGEVAGMFGVNQSLLRFWENEFDIIQPRKNRKGDRHFRPVDIKNLELIYDLLRRRKLTIEGAKDFLKKNRQARERFEMIQSLQQIKGFLLEIKASL